MSMIFFLLLTVGLLIYFITRTSKKVPVYLSPELKTYLAYLNSEMKPVGENEINKYVKNIIDQIKKDNVSDFIRLLKTFINQVPPKLQKIKRKLMDVLKES